MRSDIALSPADEAVRGALTRLVAELGHAPSTEQLACESGVAAPELPDHLRRLADAQVLLLHPGSVRPWVVHPFALAPGSCWVQCSDRGFWATCLYCAFGIAAARKCDSVVTTRLGGEGETVSYEISNGRLTPVDHVFHLSTPVARWWDNVTFACSTFQPFRRAEDVQPWCEAHDLPPGATLPMDQLWGLAQDWYGSYIERPWRKRTGEQNQEIFARNGLTGPFWAVE